jgi:glutamine amidotransferase
MIYTNCLFAHIRAATQGGVSIQNSHPFQYNQYLMMQNGGILEFNKIKRRMINLLDEEVFNWIDGQTDTQYTFALFITLAERRRKDRGKLSFDEIHGCLNETFAIIEELKKEAGVNAPSVYNLVLTDGKAMIATRYSTQPEVETRSLHLAMNAHCYICEEGNLTLRDQEKEKEGVLISSEVLTEDRALWTEVPENHFIMVEEDLTVRLKELD